MTKDLALLIGPDAPWLTTEEFLDAIDANLQKAMAGCTDWRSRLGRHAGGHLTPPDPGSALSVFGANFARCDLHHYNGLLQVKLRPGN